MDFLTCVFCKKKYKQEDSDSVFNMGYCSEKCDNLDIIEEYYDDENEEYLKDDMSNL